MNRKSLLWHIFLPFLAVSVLSLVLITVYTSRSIRGFFYDQTARDLEGRGQLLLNEDTTVPGGAMVSFLDRSGGGDPVLVGSGQVGLDR